MCTGGPGNTPTQNLTLGNADASINAISNEGGQLNSQLQGLLGGVTNNSISNPSSIESGYSAFAGNGGISPTDKSALSDEAAEAAQSTYQTGSDVASRQIAATGGYGPSGAIENSLAREGSNAASTAAVNSDASITGLQTSNELAGLTGQAGLYGTNVNQMQNLIQQILTNANTTNSGVNQAIGIKAGISENPANPGIIQNASTLGNTAAGIIGSLP